MDRRFRSAAFATLSAALFVAASALPVSAGIVGEIFVDDDAVVGTGGCDDTGTVAFDTIQDAVDAAVLEDTTILVCPGIYVGQVEIDSDDPDGLVIRSTVPWKATVRPEATDNSVNPIIGIV